MTDKRLLDFDPLTCKRTYIAEEDGKVYVQRVEDVAAVIEANKRQFNDAPSLNRTFVEIGNIPGTVLHRWCREDGINYLAKENLKLLVRKLEERDNRLFKTHPGRFA